jgi:hypothetical protein
MPRINNSPRIRNSHENEGQGTLEDYFGSNGPLTVTIKASCPSPDKTASTLVGFL